MKQLTKKQRRDIYLKAAETIDKNIYDDNSYACCLLSYYAAIKSYQVKDQFEEFMLFSPDKYNGIYVWFSGTQTGLDKKGQNEMRILALLLSAEICNDK